MAHSDALATKWFGGGWPDVRVACLWLPHLPLRVEVLRTPALDGRPLVLGSAPGERKEVRLCSPEAEAAGLRPGLPLQEVLALCREAVVVTPDPVRVARLLDDVVAGLQKVAPAIECDEQDQIFVDLAGLRALFHGDLAAIDQAMRAQVPALLRPRIGFADGKYAAAVAARRAKPGGSRVVPRRSTQAFLAPLAVAYLPLGADAQRRLELLGLRTVGDFATLPLHAAQAQFGPSGARAWQLAHGKDREPIVARGTVSSVQSSLRTDDGWTSEPALLAALDVLLARVFADPALAGRAARQARLRALLTDGSSWERLYTFKEALASRELARLQLRAKLALPGGLPPSPVEELSLELLGLGGEAARQGALFVERAEQRAQVQEAVRQLRARFGRVLLYHARRVDPWSRFPERRWRRVPCDS